MLETLANSTLSHALDNLSLDPLLMTQVPLHEVAILCLAKVPIDCIPTLRQVCRSWRTAIDSGELQRFWKESSLCLFGWERSNKIGEWKPNLWMFDTYTSTWHCWGSLPPIPHVGPTSRIVAIGMSLFLLGGISQLETTSNVVNPTGMFWRLDLMRRKVTRLNSMITHRDRFAMAVIKGKLYVAGGLGPGLNYPHTQLTSAEVYDPDANMWAPLPELPKRDRITTYDCQGGSINGKFYVRWAWKSSSADIYDPQTNQWSTDPNFFPVNSSTPRFTWLEQGSNKMFAVDKDSSSRQICVIHDGPSSNWEIFAVTPVCDVKGPSSVAQLGSKMFVLAKDKPSGCQDITTVSSQLFMARFNSQICILELDLADKCGEWQKNTPAVCNGVSFNAIIAL